jgi:hypothetical protein
MYSITSHVCRVASGAKETRLLAMDLRRAALRSASAWLGRMPLTAGTKADFLLFFISSFCSLLATSSSSPPGPMLLLRPLFAFRGDKPFRWRGSLEVAGAIFSLPATSAILSDICAYVSNYVCEELAVIVTRSRARVWCSRRNEDAGEMSTNGLTGRSRVNSSLELAIADLFKC